jgi:RHS repeat-associated protein
MSGADSFTYTYDANGNRMQQTKNGAVVQSQTVNSADQLNMAGYGHDASGNLTASPVIGNITYSPTEQMTSRAGTTTDPSNPDATSTYTYADTDQNELLKVTKPGQPDRGYTYGRTGPDGMPLIEAVVNGTATNYVIHDPQGVPMALLTSNAQTQYYAEDGLGSTVALINQDGLQTADYVYDPNGEVTVTTPTNSTSVTNNPFRYAGGTYDYSSNLIKFGMRWYDPDTGRFTQQDSIETLADPSRANRYEYAGGSPTNYVDPTGKDRCDALASCASGRSSTYSVCTSCYKPSYSWSYSPSASTVRKCGVGAGVVGGTGGRLPKVPGPWGAIGGAIIGCAGALLSY